MPVASPRRPVALLFGLIALCALTLVLALSLPGQAALAGKDGEAPPSPPGGGGPKSAQSTARSSDPSRAMPFETAPEPEANPRAGSPDREGGPDAYGYVFSDNRDPGGPSYTWRTATQRVSDTAWTLDRTVPTTVPWDDGVVTNTLPFAFNLYGVNYTQLRIATNGNVHFGPPNDWWPQAGSACLPSSIEYTPKAMVAPLF